MTAITNLYTKFTYPRGSSDLPVLVLCHGWSGDATTFGDATLQRIANYGVFVASVGMRGRDSADGANDASGREIYDLYNVLAYVRSNYSGIVSSTLAGVVGYSGGGGNALAAACKFPDTWAIVGSLFGISDYGRNSPNGWYYNNPGSFTASLVSAVGDTPANVPNKYYARDATIAIQNYSGGHIYLFHDKQDTNVPWVHGDRIKSALDGASLANYTASFTDTGASPRWLHGYPADIPFLRQAEPIYTSALIGGTPWTIPASGTVTVIGYIKTKLFTIWLNTGLDAAATVVYDTVAGTYTVTPLTSNAVVGVTITQGALAASGNTLGPTLFTVT